MDCCLILDKTRKKLISLNRTVIGGSACPTSMIKEFKEVHDVRVLHGWGMTEMSPIGLINQDKDTTKNLSGDAYLTQASKQGDRYQVSKLKSLTRTEMIYPGTVKMSVICS